MLHGLEVESQQFRAREATCGVDDDEEAAFEEHQRRTRAAAKERAAARAAEAKAKQAAIHAESREPPTIRASTSSGSMRESVSSNASVG